MMSPGWTVFACPSATISAVPVRAGPWMAWDRKLVCYSDEA